MPSRRLGSYGASSSLLPGNPIIGEPIIGCAESGLRSAAIAHRGARMAPPPLPANRYGDVLSSNTAHTAWVANIPEEMADEKGVIDLFSRNGFVVLRDVLSEAFVRGQRKRALRAHGTR